MRSTLRPEAEEGGGAVLRIADLNVAFVTGQGAVDAVKDASLSVRRGECMGVVGESGAGKTQLFLATLGLLAATARVTGGAWLGNEPLIGRSQRELDRIRGARVGLVFQDPMTSLTPHLRVGDQIAEPIVKHCGATWRQARGKALALLERVHVPDASRRMRQYPHELSGGLRQRVMIAIALACEPQLLIADEPTTALDVTIQAQILALLLELKRESGMAMVLITHDFGAVAGVADRIAVMQSGSIVELDTTAAVLQAPRHDYTRALLRRVLTLDSAAPQAAAAPQLIGTPQPPAVREAMLGISALAVQYPSRASWHDSSHANHALHDVSLELRAGEALGVVGESGSGKSTLVRAALQLIPGRAGRVTWMGRDLAAMPARELKRLRRDLQIVFQDPLASLDPRMTIGAIVAEPLETHEPRLDAAARQRRVAQMLARVGLEAGMAARYPHELSGGQCQRAGIARAMVLGPRLLVCDEPVSALDAAVQAQILDLLASLKREHDMSILLVSHNLAVVRRLCDRVLVLYRGRMMELADSEALFSRPLHPYTRELLNAVPVVDAAVQPQRLALARLQENAQAPGEDESSFAGCVFRGRCRHAIPECAARAPAWEAVPGGGWVACHRFPEVLDGMLDREAQEPP
ncbi:MAG TPA: ABC transporter ATP-binding protein [Steroidobacteraceae bacterium]|jgi:oligopeptide/dipeptide ABC transporter ATP-binding protein|nr:ABC transporter ATP-binding protein [Steroidobacteraceae bacterium]